MNRSLPVGILLLALAIGTWLLWPHVEPQAPPLPEPTPPAAAEGAAPAPAALVEATAAKPAAPEAHAERTAAPTVAAAGPVCTLRGRCVDANGQPIAGMNATLTGWGANDQRVQAWLSEHDEPKRIDEKRTTGPDGVFEFRFWPPPPFQFALRLHNDGFATWGSRWSELGPGTTKDLGDVKLERGTVLRGRVVDAAGAPLAKAEVRIDGVREVFEKVKGAYSVVGITSEGMHAFRDPYGIKPCIFGKKETPEGTYYAVASESVVLDVAGYEIVRDLKAGEMLWIGDDRVPHFRQVSDKPHRPCIFEYVYFARPDTFLDGVSVHEARLEMGRRMGRRFKETGLEADVVIPVPESARTAAQTMAEELGLRCREGFVKNRYVGRTFIMPNDKARQATIRAKLNPIRSEFEGKRVIIMDDSIVRGNTSKHMVKIARDMGAAKVYFASYSPPLLYPCLYGIDMATKREFVARDRTDEEIAKELGCDAVVYQSVAEMEDAVRSAGNPALKFCNACFAGEYPTGDITEQMLNNIEQDRVAAGSCR